MIVLALHVRFTKQNLLCDPVCQVFSEPSTRTRMQEQQTSNHYCEDSIPYSEMEDALGRYFRVLDADMQRLAVRNTQKTGIYIYIIYR